MIRIDINACFGQWPYWDLYRKTPAELVVEMGRCGIARAACMSLRGMLLDWRAGNEETLTAAAAHPDRLTPAVTISPFMDGCGRELMRLIDAGVRVVRLYPSFHNYPLDSAFVDDVCRIAGRCDVPVMIPTRPMMNWRFKAVGIEAIGAVVARHPRTTFIMSGPNYLVEYRALVKLMRQCTNAVYEISCLQGFDAVRNLVHEVGARRVLFGTGALLNYPGCNVAKLDGAAIGDEERTRIAGGNAMRILDAN